MSMAAEPAPPDDLAVTTRDIGPAVVLAPRGDLSLRTVAQLGRVLEKQLADRGRVLVDVSGLALSWRPAVEVFPTALAATTGWPAARLVLFGPPTGGLLHAAAPLSALVHVADSEVAAVLLLDVRPRRLTRRVELPCGLEAAKWGRLLVDAVCEDWDVTDVDVHAVRMVASELVSNAVLHAGTSSVLTLTLTARDLRVGVRDYRPGGGPAPADAEPGASGSMGMVLVAGVSRTWGISRHHDGKTVWASLRRGAAGRAGPQ
jgi:anti-sigma regulatory factor (Ser/Thr protein kinase)